MTKPKPDSPDHLRLKRPNRWPSGRRYRSRYLRAFQLDQRIGSILLAVTVSLMVNGAAFWLLYTATPMPLPPIEREPEPIIVMLGEPDPDPDALTDLAPLPPATDAETAGQAESASSATPAAATRSAPEALPPAPAAIAATPSPVPAVSSPAAASPVAAEELLDVTLPPPEPSTATAQDLTDLPAEIGEVLAAEVANPAPAAQASVGNAQEAKPADTEPEPAPEPEPAALRPSLPADAAERLARVLETPRVELPLATLPPQAAVEPLRALPPQLRRDPERAPLAELDPPAVEPEFAAEVLAPPLPSLPPEATPPPLERMDPTRPEVAVQPASPALPLPRPVAPPRRAELTRTEPSAPDIALADRAVELAPVAPAPAVVAVPETQRPDLQLAAPEPPRVDLPLAVRPPAAPPPVALPPASRSNAPERIRSAPLLDSPREAARLAAPAPAVQPALPPAVETDRPAATTERAPRLDREALSLQPAAPARPDPALLAVPADASPDSSAAAPTSARTTDPGTAADFGLTEARPGAPGGVDWSDSVRAATRDQVDAESAARRAARAPWQRDEAWFADDPPARMQQMLRDDPNLARTMVNFLAGVLAAGAQQTPHRIYKVGPDPGVMIQLWLDRHHGNLQLACLRDAAGMPEAARRVLCPGERIEALEFDAAKPVGE